MSAMLKSITHKLPLVPLCICLMLVFIPGCSNNSGATGTGAPVGKPQVTGKPTAIGKPKATVSDLDFARTAFKALAHGDTAARNLVDWDNFQAMGQNMGAVYKSLPDDKQRAAFRSSLVTSFSASFKKSGASAETLSNWRVKSAGKGATADTVIAADSPNKATLLLTVSKRNGSQKLAALNLGK